MTYYKIISINHASCSLDGTTCSCELKSSLFAVHGRKLKYEWQKWTFGVIASFFNRSKTGSDEVTDVIWTLFTIIYSIILLLLEWIGQVLIKSETDQKLVYIIIIGLKQVDHLLIYKKVFNYP